MIVVSRVARRRNLECGDKSRAVRGSRHRFLSALCAEPHLVPTLSRIHLVSTLSRLRQRRSVSTKFKATKCFGRSVSDEVFERSVGTSVCSSAGKQTLAPPGAPRVRVPHAFIAQRFACMGGSAHETRARCPCHVSASLRLCVKNFSTLNFMRARGTRRNNVRKHRCEVGPAGRGAAMTRKGLDIA